MTDKSIKPAKPERPKPEPVKTVPIKPIPVTPAKAHAHGTICVRCGNNPVEVRSICVPCDQVLSGMHTVSEYRLYDRTYYIPSQEGTSFEWLMNSHYKRDIVLSYSAKTERVQAKEEQTLALVNSS